MRIKKNLIKEIISLTNIIRIVSKQLGELLIWSWEWKG